MSDLPQIWDDLWQRLHAGVSQPNAPARTLALATRHLDEGASVRTVVLRKADQSTGQLEIFTHSKAAKVAELTHDSTAELLLWDAGTQFQARLRATVNITEGPQTAWASLGSGSRKNYAPSLKPGTPIAAPQEAPEGARQAFTLLTATLLSVDILDLSHLPHKRAIYSTPDFTGQWVAP